jgi:hypothetical protein
MSATPLQVLTRPFAVEPITNIMLPDGIFDNAITTLQISAHFINQSVAALTGVTLYLESIGDPGIVSEAQTFTFASIPAGASVLVQWRANFRNASPGKPLVSFIAEADGFDPRRSIQQIFVSQTRFNLATNTYTCTTGEGSLAVSGIAVITAGATWAKANICGKCGGGGSGAPIAFPPFIPTGMTMVWTPSPAYAGMHGDLPFSDPWWKVLAIIVAIIAAIVAAIAAAAGAGAVNISVGGTFDETGPTVHCCTPKGISAPTGWTVAGVASTICSGAIVVACSDAADPFFRGQAATPPAAGETTVAEQVVAKWDLPDAPNAGVPYTADVHWTYTRFTTGNTYNFSVTETQTNIHTAGDVQIDTPVTIQAPDPLWVEARFANGSGGFFTGNQLWAFAVFQAPNNGLYFVVPIRDDGIGFDKIANDGVYSGELNLEGARRILLDNGEDVYGVWRVFLYAQEVNLTAPGTPPEIAAQTIGGFFVASALTLTFDPSLPCPLKAQASINVV